MHDPGSVTNVPAVKYVDPFNTSGTSEVGLRIGANLDYRICEGNPAAASTEVFVKVVKQVSLSPSRNDSATPRARSVGSRAWHSVIQMFDLEDRRTAS